MLEVLIVNLAIIKSRWSFKCYVNISKCIKLSLSWGLVILTTGKKTSDKDTHYKILITVWLVLT